jgi:hypothetical protein
MKENICPEDKFEHQFRTSRIPNRQNKAMTVKREFIPIA